STPTPTYPLSLHDALPIFDLVEAVVGTAIVGDAVEDEELRLRPEIGDVADAGRLEVLLRFLRDEPGVARILLLRNRIDDVADKRSEEHTSELQSRSDLVCR